MSDTLTLAINGDMTAFSKLYANNYKKIYIVAYHSLANEKEAVESVKYAADQAYEEIGSCKSESDFSSLFLKKLCEKIIACFREYRKSAPTPEAQPTYIKAHMSRLTDAERLSVAIWTVYGLNPGDIAKLTGLAADVVKNKLESGKTKIESKL